MSEKIHTAICKILKDFSAEAVNEGHIDDSNYWTKEITCRICCEGKLRGFETYSKYHGGEWCYDLCWVERYDGFTKSLPVALECEWNPSPEIEEDFEKLLWSRAQLRVMIFDATHKSAFEGEAKGWAQDKVEELRKRVEFFSDTQAGDAYLFGVWCHDKGGCYFHFEHGEVVYDGSTLSLDLRHLMDG